jgi:hypothetical protein
MTCKFEQLFPASNEGIDAGENRSITEEKIISNHQESEFISYFKQAKSSK